MDNIVDIESKRKNLFLVDNRYIILAHTAKQASNFLQFEEGVTEEFSSVKFEDQKSLPVIMYDQDRGIELILWTREPNEDEVLSRRITTREFIDGQLSNYKVPSIQDFVEDAEFIEE